jgi:hypothetical protein
LGIGCANCESSQQARLQASVSQLIRFLPYLVGALNGNKSSFQWASFRCKRRGGILDASSGCGDQISE